MAKNATNGRTNGYQATHALLYSRVSTDDQAREGLSLPAQLADCRRYAAERGWIIGAEHQDILSGTRDDRPGYQHLLAEARRLRGEGRPVAIVVTRLDRFGRRLLERARAAEELRGLGAPVHSVHEGGEVPELVGNVLAAVAQEEVKRLGERVSAVRQHAVGQGWAFPGKAALGYCWRPRTEVEKAAGAPAVVLDVDLDRAPIVVEAFRRAAAGESTRAIALWIMSLPAEARLGRAFGVSAIWGLLTSPVYVSRPEHGDPDVLARAVGRWPSLVSDEVWQAAQDRRRRHARLPNQASGHYLLTGMLRCGRCGARMAGCYIQRPTGRRYYQYRCQAEKSGATAVDPRCRYSTTTAVDAVVLAEVGRVLDMVAQMEVEAPGDLRREWQRLMQPEGADDLARQITTLERQAERARRRLTDAALLLVDGALDRAGYELARDAARADLDAAEAEIVRLRGAARPPTLPPLAEVLSLAGGWRAMLADPAAPTAAKREVLALLVERVLPIRIGCATYRADVTWTARGAALRSLAGPGSQ